MGSSLDGIFSARILRNGISFIQRKTLEFVGPFVVEDVPTLRRTRISLDMSDPAFAGQSKVDFANYYSPVAAYLFAEGNHLTDRSGNSITLTASASPVKFGPSYVLGYNAVRLSSGLLELRSTNTALNLIGAWSGEVVVNPFTWVNNNYLASWRDFAGSETEANNISWTLGGAGGSAATDAFGGAYWEFGAGTDVIPTGHGYLPPGGSAGGSAGWIHVCQTRSSGGRLRTYVNGRLIFEATGLTMPTGGSTAQMRIGGQFGLYQYSAFYNQELTGAQVLDLAQKRMGLKEAA